MGFAATIWKLLTSKLAGPILGGALVLSLVGNTYQYIRDSIVISGLRSDKADLEQKNSDLTRDNAILRANQATLQSSITTQNAAVDGLKSAADLAAAQARTSQANFNAAADALDAQATAIGKLPALPTGADRCAAASTLIRNTLAAEHKQ
jgi:hypothetical protein